MPGRNASDLAEGIQDGLLFIPFLFPIGISIAVAGQLAGVPDWAIVLWSALIYAGSAQLACLSAASGGAGLVELMIVTFMANARHGLLSMAMVPFLGEVKRNVLPVVGFTLATSSTGLLPAKALRGGDLQAYALGAQVCQWAQAVLFTALGVWLGPQIPPAWGPVVAFAVPAGFLGLVLPLVLENARTGPVVALVATGLGLGLTVFWPPQLCAIAGAFGGAAATLLIPER